MKKYDSDHPGPVGTETLTLPYPRFEGKDLATIIPAPLPGQATRPSKEFRSHVWQEEFLGYSLATDSLPSVVPIAPQTPYGLGPLGTGAAARFPVLMVCEINRTDPSQKTDITPPG